MNQAAALAKSVDHFEEGLLFPDAGLEQYLPSVLQGVPIAQTEIPRIARDTELLKEIQRALARIPTSHFLIHGDARIMSAVETDSVHLVLTSPPYWTLKRYNEHAGQMGHIVEYEEFLDELLDIISRYKIWPVTSAVVAEDWNALTFDERRYLSGVVFGQGKYRKGGAPTKPYFVAFLLAVQCVAAYCDAGHTVDLVMDGSDALNGYGEVYFQELRASHNRNAARLGTIQAGDSRILPGLQAADLLAYLTQRFCRKNPVPGQGLEDDTPLGRAVKKARDPKDFKLFNGAAFDLLLAEFRKDATLGETRSRRGP